MPKMWMVSCAVVVAGVVAESVTVTVAVYVPAVAVEPLSWPPSLRLMPAGRPDVENLYGGVPPEAVNEPVIAAPVPAPAVRFDGLAWRVVPDGTTLSGIFAVRVCPVLVSVAVKDTSESPAAVGVPPSEPAAERVTPPGNPDAVHVNEPEPPFAL